jgi:hypothetical protein
MSPKKKKNIYCFDSSSLIVLGMVHTQVMEIPKALWSRLDSSFTAGEIISHRLVFDEISSNAKNPDFIARWIADKKSYFLGKTPMQVELVVDIIKAFPKLIDYQSEHEQADPWLIALAMEKSKENTLFYINLLSVVTQESPRSSQKIPAACKHFGIQCKSLKDFFKNNNMDIKF